MTVRIVHGGNLHEAAQRYGIPYGQWLDLSTGINPHAYPVPPVPADAWRRLPDEDDDFAACAARYYGAPDALHVLPVAGSQTAIRALPALLPRASVAVAALTYSEYAPAFERAGHRIVPLDLAWDVLPEDVTHIVVANPNNPTADRLSAAKLLQWHAQLVERGGTLVVDEAFVDAYDDELANGFGEGFVSSVATSLVNARAQPGPTSSLAAFTSRAGLVVLRSPGKFFGLAGARAGFVLAATPLLDALHDVLGAWTVSGPARHAVSAAFDDLAWQRDMRTQLAKDSARLTALLQAQRFASRGTPLFAWTADARAAALHHQLALRGIWTRLFSADGSVRFGLPGTEAQWQRLEAALVESVQALDRTTEQTTRDPRT
ncbi:threonine-phosphate decarboxylase [Paraburkholderia sp. DHOC27]|uniref:threonine-phosphate decarboxylase n=1 Tax=Paraburkholderia sp. DHOC27 TaxID=2303330 RepID=UPI000E3BEDBA|nr:threonine-phosphate decarboxylase [Paraburkholderia sp. DHOC27]RFU46098.1 aminotransferase class I/II-fold pyridoxal phosphate-dependent enzyme [Paraburkholderia sp. DHOC27]